MYFKRFAQLFIIFLIALAAFTVILETNFGNFWLRFFLGVLVAYIVLTLPLVLLTIAKANKKANAVGVASPKSEFSLILKDFPGYLALSVSSGQGKSSTTIMSFIQAQNAENQLYMVAEKTTTKVQNLKQNSVVSFTTWFDNLEKGGRLSSNRVTAEILEDVEAKAIVKIEPLILSLHENAGNMSIIRLNIHSALYENFKGQLTVINFEKERTTKNR